MAVYVRSEGLAARPVKNREVIRRAERMLQALKCPRAELSVLLCADEVMRRLNREFRHKDRPTDVLAFPAQAVEVPGELGGLGRDFLLGDVAISLPTARRQAMARGHSIAHEVTFLMAHGVLHLAGYDHQTDAQERVMDAETARLVAAAIGKSGG